MAGWRSGIFAVAGFVLLLVGCAERAERAERVEDGAAGLAERGAMPAALQTRPELSGRDIIALAHRAAGGELFLRPASLILRGYNIQHSAAGEVLWDRYAMWREFAAGKQDAHNASGKVRIEGWSGGELALLLAFDGERTYTEDGPMPDQSANAMWASNFGFGAIRHALDEGWQQRRLPDRLIDGQVSHIVELTDPSGGKTLFGVRSSDHAICYVGFRTPRGWHERRYSHYFGKPGSDWRQAGRVRLFYDGVKANEAIWTDFEVNEKLPDELFVIVAEEP